MKAKIIRDPLLGYLRVDPIPTKEEVDRYYREEFYAQTKPGEGNDSSLEKMREEAEFHRRSHDDIFHLLTRNGMLGINGGETVADVGCGYGVWIEYLEEQGVSAYGVDPVQDAVDHILKSSHRAHCVPIEDMVIPPDGKRVTGVTMLNALEHLRDPAEALRNFTQNWIVPEGFIAVRVPNEFNALQVTADNIYGLDQWWVVPPRHINYFDLTSLTKLFEACGLEVVDYLSTFPLELFLLMGDDYTSDSELGKQCHRRRVLFEKNMDDNGQAAVRRDLYKCLADVGLGRQIIAVGKKRGR